MVTRTSYQTQMIKKQFIGSQTLLDASFELAIQVYKSNFKPDYIIGIWRGGTPVGIAVQELLEYLGVTSDHIAIRTSSYTNIAERSKSVKVHGLHYIIENIQFEDSLLIVDDVYDTGLSIRQVISDIADTLKENTPTIKIATPYFKPGNNKTDRIPDFYIHETDNWLVFPHELIGLSENEIKANKPNLHKILKF